MLVLNISSLLLLLRTSLFQGNKIDPILGCYVYRVVHVGNYTLAGPVNGWGNDYINTRFQLANLSDVKIKTTILILPWSSLLLKMENTQFFLMRQL